MHPTFPQVSKVCCHRQIQDYSKSQRKGSGVRGWAPTRDTGSRAPLEATAAGITALCMS